jgi:hypothetical protein
LNQITLNTIKDYISSNHPLLLSSHKKLSLPVIRRIYSKMRIGIKFDEIKVCEGIIIDGHHRYISSLLANYKIGQVPSSKTSATVPCEWKTVEFVDEEWDTEAKIAERNRQDAEYNGVDLKILIEMTNKS